MPVTSSDATETMAAEKAGSSTTAAAVPLEQPIDPNSYVCGPGDTFELNFWGQQNFRLRMAADLEGRVFISKVGFVSVSGKSLTVVRSEVTKKVRANYPGLQFALTLVAPRTFVVHVVDNVARPGAHTAHALERISSVLARVGTVNGSRRRISIKHASGSISFADLVLYELTGDTKHNPFVLDGDVVSVPFAEVTVSIDGAVRRPGTYELVGSKDLQELLSLAGGFKADVLRSMPVRIVRRNETNHAEFIDVPFTGGAAPNRGLVDLDRVTVNGAEAAQRYIFVIGVVSGADQMDSTTTSKRMPYIEGDSVLSLLDRAGGINVQGDLKRAYISRPRAEGAPLLIPVALDSLLLKRDLSADKPISLGDTLVIPPVQHGITVEGAVARAGMYPYNPLFGAPQYIARAGGRTRTARDLEDIRLIDTSGRTRKYSDGMKVAPGDAILVPERNWTRGEIVQLIFAGAGLALSTVALTYAVTQ